jgi:methyl-accepting chemotaxis protein
MNVRSLWGRIRARYRYRVVAGVLVVSLPITVLLGFMLTRHASASLTGASKQAQQSVARAVALRLEDWISERHENMTTLAGQAAGRLGDPATAAALERVDKLYADYRVIEVTDLTGRVLASSRPGTQVDVANRDWFRAAVAAQPVLSTVTDEDGELHWFVAAPVLDASGRPEGVVAGDLDVTVLADVLNPEVQRGTEVIAVDREHNVIYTTEMGKAADGAALIAKGALRTRMDNAAITAALAGNSGATSFRDARGHDAFGGYDAVDELGWAILVSQHRSVALARVASQRSTALWLIAAGALLAVAFALWFARRESRNLVALAEEGKTASNQVNASASELSASSEELAATTTEQSAAVTEASATTEELARASASIAETVDAVAAQAAETRDNLELAEADIQASSERTVALAERVNEIGAILTLINEISDQTNLLALNAAIEAARAGEGGRGFAVVADEVRRLAERSKSSAADIAAITEGVHNETNATVMAMEKGAKQMQRGLALLDDVTQATEHVRLTTQQQRSATGQVVETMEQLSDASRQVSATAQQIAQASASLADLANNLEHSAANATTSE